MADLFVLPRAILVVMNRLQLFQVQKGHPFDDDGVLPVPSYAKS